MGITIERVLAPTPEVRDLVDELNRTLAALYTVEQQHGLPLDQLFAPGVLFLVARLDEAIAGCGGIAFMDGYAEVKRMYTRAPLRRRGVAQALLRRLEAEARDAGIATLRLETGAHQPEAIRLYERAGFQRCAPFGAYATMPAAHIELSLFYQKTL